MRAHHETLFSLALAAEYKDDDTGVHIVRVGFMAEALALQLGHSREWAAQLRKAAPMHDVGKIGIPGQHFEKTRQSFTPEERLVMNRHSAIGADSAGQVAHSACFSWRLKSPGTRTLGWHRLPAGLGRRGHSFVWRMVSAVDFDDALTMYRVHRPPGLQP